jgi:hypothetical protein
MYYDIALGDACGRLHCLCQAGLDTGLQHQAINHNLDVMLEFLVEDDLFRKIAHITVDTDAREALFC